MSATAALVVAIDFGAASNLALKSAMERAIERARVCEHVEVHVVHAVPTATLAAAGTVAIAAPPIEELRAEMRALVHETWATYTRADPNVAGLPIHFSLHTTFGEAGTDTVDLATRVHAEAIFVGTHGRTGVARLFLGSVAEYIVRHAQTTVVVSRAPAARPASTTTAR